MKNIWLAFSDNRKDKKRIDILLKIVERSYSKSPGMQTLTDESMIDICKGEGVFPEQVFFAFLYCLPYRYGLSAHSDFCGDSGKNNR